MTASWGWSGQGEKMIQSYEVFAVLKSASSQLFVDFCMQSLVSSRYLVIPFDFICHDKVFPRYELILISDFRCVRRCFTCLTYIWRFIEKVLCSHCSHGMLPLFGSFGSWLFEMLKGRKNLDKLFVLFQYIRNAANRISFHLFLFSLCLDVSVSQELLSLEFISAEGENVSGLCAQPNLDRYHSKH